MMQFLFRNITEKCYTFFYKHYQFYQLETILIQMANLETILAAKISKSYKIGQNPPKNRGNCPFFVKNNQHFVSIFYYKI